MLTQQVPQQEIREIDCSKIKKFSDKLSALAYAEDHGGMVLKEHAQEIYYVMPVFNGVMVGACAEEE